MTAYELFILAKPMLDKLKVKDVNLNYIEYVDLYKDYIQMKQEQHKVTYIASHLCEVYNITEYKFYSIIKQFRRQV